MENLLNVKQVKKKISRDYLSKLDNAKLGLPEYDDRTKQWRTAIIFKNEPLGFIYYNANSGKLDEKKSTSLAFMKKKQKSLRSKISKKASDNGVDNTYYISPLKNSLLILGDSNRVLKKMPANSIDLVFTSPPYYNAKPEYSEFFNYLDYLSFIKKIVKEITRVLIPGKFFVIDSSPVLIPRVDRSHSSTRLAVPYDIHKIFMDLEYEFVDDIYWVKPEGAGWTSGRGRRFAADRHPMQYKAVPVTENIMVYRKKSDKLIDWFIQKHPNPNLVEESKISKNYDKTNIWRINPAKDKRHPAVFPQELAEKVIRYYSFKNDYVLDPFGGLGTTAKAALSLNRNFVSIELVEKYFYESLKDLKKDYNLEISSGKVKIINHPFY